jgi:transketolase
MTILSTGDATEVESVLDVAQAVNGPVYVRFLRGEVPRLFPKSEPMELGKARILSKGNDVTIFSSGICTEEAMRATKVLTQKGVSINHLHISTLKPFIDEEALAAIQTAKYGIITMENHLTVGGLGSIIAELIADHGIGKKLTRIGLQDTYAHGASRAYLMKEYGLDAISLVRSVEKVIGSDLDISEDDLEAVRLEAVHSLAKAEGL